jgi:tetratricopeptide (TPR) repeat protein
VCPVSFTDGKIYDRDALFDKAFKNSGLVNGVLVDSTTTSLNTSRLQAIYDFIKSDPVLASDWNKRRKKFEVEEQRKKKTNVLDKDSKAFIVQNCTNLVVLGDVRKAREYFDSNVVFTEDVDLLQINGRIYMAEGEHRKAYEEFRKAMTLKPKLTQDLYWDMCLLFQAKGDFGEAVRYNLEAEKTKGLREKKKHIERMVDVFEQGLGVQKDLIVAKGWAKKLSSTYKEPKADLFLAKHESREGNTVTAVTHLGKAAKRKHVGAQELLTKINGVVVDWFDIPEESRRCI